MKLKEKLAKEYVSSREDYQEYYENDISQNNYTDMRGAFLAGFDKAVELASKTFHESRALYSGMEFSTAFAKVLESLSNLGEY